MISSSCVLRLACKLNPSPRNCRRTVVSCTSNPCYAQRQGQALNAAARPQKRRLRIPARNALQDRQQRLAEPRFALFDRWTPSPGRRTRPSGARWPLRTSAIPRRTVSVDIPVALTTAAIPPRPCERASAAAHIRRARSSSSSRTTSHRSRIGPSSTIGPNLVTSSPRDQAKPPRQHNINLRPGS